MQRALKRAGYATRAAAGLREGLLKAKGCGVILLDVLLPDGNGLSYVSEFRRIGGGEVLIMSSLTGETEVTEGLEKGGDDYIRKPFSMQELVARVGVAYRRLGGEMCGFSETLTCLEQRLLQILMHAAGETLDRRTLYREVWGCQGGDVDSRSVDAAVVRLRKKIGLRSDGGQYIETVWGKGYRWNGEKMGCTRN